jgi:hypothetical protein
LQRGSFATVKTFAAPALRVLAAFEFLTSLKPKDGIMSLGLILVIILILIIFLLGGFSGRFGGYGYGFTAALV